MLMPTLLPTSLLNTLQHVIFAIASLSQKPLGMSILKCVKKSCGFPCSDVSVDVELVSKIIFDLK